MPHAPVEIVVKRACFLIRHRVPIRFDVYMQQSFKSMVFYRKSKSMALFQLGSSFNMGALLIR